MGVDVKLTTANVGNQSDRLVFEISGKIDQKRVVEIEEKISEITKSVFDALNEIIELGSVQNVTKDQSSEDQVLPLTLEIDVNGSSVVIQLTGATKEQKEKIAQLDIQNQIMGLRTCMGDQLGQTEQSKRSQKSEQSESSEQSELLESSEQSESQEQTQQAGEFESHENQHFHLTVNLTETLSRIVHSDRPEFQAIFNGSGNGAALPGLGVDKVSDQAEVQVPVEDKVQGQGLNSSTAVSKKEEINLLIRFIRRFLTYVFVLQPAVEMQIKVQLKNIKVSEDFEQKGPEIYGEKFPDLLSNAGDWVDSFIEKNPEIEEVYNKNELVNIYEKLLIQRVNHARMSSRSTSSSNSSSSSNINLKKLPPFRDDEIRRFRIMSTVKNLTKPGCSKETMERELYRIRAAEMPYEILKDIPLTGEIEGDQVVLEGVQEVLVNTWVRVLSELYTTGRLDKIDSVTTHKERLIQADCAAKFIQAYSLMPEGIKDEIKNEIENDILKKIAIEKLITFAIAQNCFYDSKIVLSDQKLTEKQRVYNEKIKPQLNKVFIDVLIGNLPADVLMNDSKIINFILAGKGEFLIKFMENIKNQFNSNEKELWSEEGLKDMFYVEMERKAIFEYYFTDLQIENLRIERFQNIEIDELLTSKYFEDVQSSLNEFDNKISDLDDEHDDILLERLDTLDNNVTENEIKEIEEQCDEQMRIKIAEELKNRLNILKHPMIFFKKFPEYLQKIDFSDSNAIMRFPLIEHIVNDLLGDEKLDKINGMSKQLALNYQVLEILKLFEEIEKLNLSVDEKKFLREKFNKFSEKITNQLTLDFLKKPVSDYKNPWQVDGLLNDEVIEEIRNEGFDHPSNIDKSIICGLLEITQMLSRVNAEPSVLLTDEQKERLLETLNGMSKKTDLITKLKVFKRSEDASPAIFAGFVNTPQKEYYKIPAGITSEALKMVEDYVNMLKKYKDLALSLNKARILIDKFKVDSNQIRMDDRLSYNELRKLNKLSEYGETITQLEKLGLSDHPDFQDCQKSVKEAIKIKTELDAILHPQYYGHYKNGDIMGYSGKKKMAWIGRPLGGMEKLTMLIADYGLTHGMKIYKAEKKLRDNIQGATGENIEGLVEDNIQGKTENKVEVSHVYGAYQNDVDLSLYQVAISDAWRLNLEPLFSPKIKSVLEPILGPSWSIEVQKKFQEIEGKIHEDKNRFKGIKNNSDRRVKAGMADFYPVINLFGGFAGEKLLGHLQEHPQDFSPIYDQFLRQVALDDKGAPNPADQVVDTQICSEFVSKSTLAALIGVNKWLTSELLKNDKYSRYTGEEILKFIENEIARINVGQLNPQEILKLFENKTAGIQLDDDVKEYLNGKRHWGDKRSITEGAEKKLKVLLEKLGKKPEEIDLILRINNEEIFDLPYDRRERLQAIHPGRMIKILEKKKCIQKVEPPEAFRKLIKIE